NSQLIIGHAPDKPGFGYSRIFIGSGNRRGGQLLYGVDSGVALCYHIVKPAPAAGYDAILGGDGTGEQLNEVAVIGIIGIPAQDIAELQQGAVMPCPPWGTAVQAGRDQPKIGGSIVIRSSTYLGGRWTLQKALFACCHCCGNKQRN